MTGSVYAHFIGIGGAGMSGIARVLNARGVRVTGSDLKESRYSRSLREEGIPVAVGHVAENLGEPEVVVVSSAIPESNPELTAARERGIEIWPRARMLAYLAGDLQTVAVAGTHGKTTTSAMIATMLDGMELDPTYLVGGEVSDRGTNASCGTGDHYVVEADESDGSFVFLDPYVAVVTNVEADHLDHYDSLAHVEDTFCEFMDRVPSEGSLVVCADDERLVALASIRSAPMVTYGRRKDADVRYSDMKREGVGHHFRVSFPDDTSVEVFVAAPGEHMVQNVTAALATAWTLELDTAAAAKAVSQFGGVRRRFDRVGEIDGVDIVDDYAHHPTEVRATLKAAKECGYERVWVIFQPHRYSRTAALAEDFGQAFEDADRVVLLDVYSAGETPIPGVTGKTLVNAVLDRDPRSRVTYLPHRGDIAPYIEENTQSGDIVMTMGAGDVTSVGPELMRFMEDSQESGISCR